MSDKWPGVRVSQRVPFWNTKKKQIEEMRGPLTHFPPLATSDTGEAFEVHLDIDPNGGSVYFNVRESGQVWVTIVRPEQLEDWQQGHPDARRWQMGDEKPPSSHWWFNVHFNTWEHDPGSTCTWDGMVWAPTPPPWEDEK